jgi:hypothetical protein
VLGHHGAAVAVHRLPAGGSAAGRRGRRLTAPVRQGNRHPPFAGPEPGLTR